MVTSLSAERLRRHFVAAESLALVLARRFAFGLVVTLASCTLEGSSGPLARADEPAPTAPPPVAAEAVAPTAAEAVAPAAAEAAEAAPAIPLHLQIDELVEAAAIGPLASLSSDADFVRRVYLDLTGVIPPADTVKAFLADPSPNKREAVIDALLQTPDFARHFAVQLDVLLLDRRPEKYVDAKQWQGYLIDAIYRRKPLDQVFRELIAPDTTGDDLTPARKFLLTSTVEPHAMTRDVGRVVFGMDLQCAQCHDHPLISDYLQEDYYGLFAFLNRTTLFEDPKSKSGILAEKPDGDTSFQSVFTGSGKPLMPPRVPRGFSLYTEPNLFGDAAYKVKPDKEHASKPVYSRREALAKMLAESSQFRRNLANRLWSLLTGRGLVHPTDFHYADNPPVNPKLLTLLADDIAAHRFDLRYMVREVLLSRTYQRSCEPPRPETINFADVKSRKADLATERAELLARGESMKGQVEAAEKLLRESLATNDKLVTEAAPLQTKLAEARKAFDAAVAAQTESQKAFDALVAKAASIDGVLVSAKGAAALVPESSELTQAVAMLQARAAELAAASTAAKTANEAKVAAVDAAKQGVAQIETDIAAIHARGVPADKLTQLERSYLVLSTDQLETDANRRLVEAQIILCDSLIEYPAASASDRVRGDALWESIVERWSLRGQVAPLKPLTPEQLAASAMRATGFLAKSEAAAKAALEKTPPKELEKPDLSEDEKKLIGEVALQAELLQQLRGNVNQFVGQFSAAGSQEFQATVNQALFLGNGPTLNSWVAAGGDTLVGRLKDQADTDALAEELSLAVFSRPATADERLEIARFLAPADPAQKVDRSAALGQWVWAMITSNEFRFNH